MIRRSFIPGAALVLLAVSTSAQVRAKNPETLISGVVRDSHGTPQIGALVELLRPDLSVLAEAATDDHGRYLLSHVPLGVYELKASNAAFLPTLRENVEIASTARVVANLTLNTLYEAFRWLPARPRSSEEPADDWTWALRLSANRPLLRVMQDGPLVVVADPDGSRSLKARVTIRGGESGFGDGGLHHDFEFARTSDDERGLVLRADLIADPVQGDSPAVKMVAGYEHRLTMDNTVRSVGIFEDRPAIAAGNGNQGLSAFALRNSEAMQLMPGVSAEVGDEVRGMHLSNTSLLNYPFAVVKVQAGATTVSYQVATTPDAQRAGEVDQFTNLSAAVTQINGRLVAEHGLHQSITVSRGTEDSRMHANFGLYHDHIVDPVVGGGGVISNAELNSGNLLFDPITEMLSAAGPGFNTTGFLADLHEKVDSNLWLAVDAASGDALTYTGGDGLGLPPDSIMQQIDRLQAHEAQMLAASLNGRMPHAGTEWRVAYRWQTGRTVTPVAPFATGVPDAYMSVYLRQPIHYRHLPNGMEALVDVRNLLAEGYRPFLTSDGSALYFAQVSRCVEGGVSFSF